MTTIVGGLRDRLITENIRIMLVDALTNLGWFDSNTQLRSMPLQVRTEPVPPDEEAKPNIIAISSEDIIDTEAEMGSNLSDFTYTYAIDIYAERASTGKHLAGDVRSILQGRFPSIGRTEPHVEIYDLSMATPMHVFTVDLENIMSGRQRHFAKGYEKFWWTVMFDVKDEYGDEYDV